MAWADKKDQYARDYVRNRQIRCYPPLRDLKFIRGIQERTGMGESETMKYLIQVARETIEPKPVKKHL